MHVYIILTCIDGEYLENTLLNIVRKYYLWLGQHEVANVVAPVHRLGRGIFIYIHIWQHFPNIIKSLEGTSGAILFSKTAKSGKSLGVAMQKRTIKKKYRALVEGLVEKDEFPIEQPIGPVPYPFITHTGKCQLSTWTSCYNNFTQVLSMQLVIVANLQVPFVKW